MATNAKKEFEWKSSSSIGEVVINDKKKVEVQYNTLDFENEAGTEERDYISLTTQQFFKRKGQDEAQWNITKNATFPLDAFAEIVEIVTGYMEENE